MIPTPAQLEEISRLREGRFHEVPFPVLLCALATHERTLVVEIRRNQVSKKIVFDFGVPIDCRSNLVHETLGRFLASHGKLREDEIHPYLSQAAARSMHFGAVLVEHGVLSEEELAKTLQQNLAKKLLDMFTWRDGEFRILFDIPILETSRKVKVPQLIVTGVTKFAPQEDVDAAVVPLVGRKLALHPSPHFALEDIRLTPRQSQLAVALRAGWRIDELAMGTGLPFEEITRLLYALAILGVVVPSDQLAKAAPKSSPTGTIPMPVPPAPAPVEAATTPFPILTAPVPTAPPPVDPALAERRRNEVMQAFLSFRKQDAFDLLGLPEDATAALVEERYLDFSRRFAPWSLDGPDLQPMREKASELFAAGARAYAELTDAEQRNTLLFRRKTLRDERDRKLTGQFTIKTDLLDPDVQYKKGRALVDAGKYREAVQLLEFAADCDPQNGIYSAELAYCRFLLSPYAGNRSLKELQETLRRDPECGLAVYYSGEIHRQLGNRDDAETHLRRAIKMMHPDRRPIEALKALSVEKKK